jgi:hypothetical protein
LTEVPQIADPQLYSLAFPGVNPELMVVLESTLRSSVNARSLQLLVQIEESKENALHFELAAQLLKHPV